MNLSAPQKVWEGFRVIVLGSTSGIGLATARTLVEAGADVIIHGRSIEKAGGIAQGWDRMTGRCEPIAADLYSRYESDRLVEQAWNLWGGLDAWIHFAGADILTGSGRNLGFEQKMDTLLQVDLVSTIRLCREVGRLMKDQGSGSILTMGWDQAETGMEGDSGELFCATKGAIMAFTRSLSLSLAPEVRVNSIAPGWIQTSWGETTSSVWQDRVMRETPLKRWGKPEDVAEVAKFIIGPEAKFLTGQTIRINGGAVR